MAAVDYDYRFLFVDVGCQGRVGDAGVFQHSSLFNALEARSLNVPGDSTLSRSDIMSPYVFVGDDAFPLKTYLLKPYAHRGLNQKERIFNYRLSRARRVVENAFGILAARFRVFRSPMEIQPHKAKKVVLAAVVLHNFLRERGRRSNAITAAAFTDLENNHCIEVPNMKDPKPCRCNASLKAKLVRNNLAEYFMTAGQVSWQWDIV